MNYGLSQRAVEAHLHFVHGQGRCDSHLGEAHHSWTQHWGLSHGSTLGRWNTAQLSHLEPQPPLPYPPGTLFSSLPHVQYGHCTFLILYLKDKYKVLDDTQTELEAQSFLWLCPFHLAVLWEEMEGVLLLSGFWQIRKPLALCMPKPALGRNLHSIAFAQEGSVLKELFSALLLLSMSLSTKDYPYHSNFGTGSIMSLDASPDSSSYWFNTAEKQQQPLLLKVFSLLHSRQLVCQKQISWGMCWLRQPLWRVK